jgi:hypothetical protein
MIWTQSNTPNWVPCLTDQAEWTFLHITRRNWKFSVILNLNLQL